MTHSADGLPHLAHWGAFSARWEGHALQVRPHPNDLDVEWFDGPLPPIRAFEPPAVCSPP